MSFLYTAYGITIASDIPLPELVTDTGLPDVCFRLGEIQRLPDEIARQGDFVRSHADEAILFWEEVGVFLVRQGCEIIIQPYPGADDGLLRVFLLGSALGLLLHQRGLLTLHASAVEINGGAIAFIGWKGYGKSTTAAALNQQGYHLLTDDIVAIDLQTDKQPIVLPGYPQIKLQSDAATALVENSDQLPRLHPEINKLAHRPCETFALTSLPLQAIFLLDQGPEAAIETVPLQDAFMALVSQSYALRFLKTTGATPKHFQQCQRLVQHVPIRRLRRPYGLEVLPEVVRLIENQFMPTKQTI